MLILHNQYYFMVTYRPEDLSKSQLSWDIWIYSSLIAMRPIETQDQVYFCVKFTGVLWFHWLRDHSKQGWPSDGAIQNAEPKGINGKLPSIPVRLNSFFLILQISFSSFPVEQPHWGFSWNSLWWPHLWAKASLCRVSEVKSLVPAQYLPHEISITYCLSRAWMSWDLTFDYLWLDVDWALPTSIILHRPLKARICLF